MTRDHVIPTHLSPRLGAPLGTGTPVALALGLRPRQRLAVAEVGGRRAAAAPLLAVDLAPLHPGLAARLGALRDTIKCAYYTFNVGC